MLIGALNSFLAHRRAVLYLLIIWEALIGYAYYTGTRNWIVGIGTLAVPPSILAFFLAQYYGSPTKWWAAFFGISIDVNLKRFESEYSHRGEVLRDEITEWLRITNLKPHYQTNAFRHLFLRKKHAIMFKMAWG